MILADNGTVIEMPPKNKNCPCNSKKKYKNCCIAEDIAKKTGFIEKR
jgi:uncharacterized protein YecA (UPF0149 family)